MLLVDIIAKGLGVAPTAGALQSPCPDHRFTLVTETAQVPCPALIPPLTAGPGGLASAPALLQARHAHVARSYLVSEGACNPPGLFEGYLSSGT